MLGGRLAAQGFDVTVLDISDSAINRAKSRVGEVAGRMRWIVGDVTDVPVIGEFDLWHDRAVFHFLTEPEDRRRYVAMAERTIGPGGYLVIGTFGLRGPEQCSGLPVERYDQVKLAAAFGEGFSIVKAFDDTHITPWGRPQAFLFAVMLRTTAEPIAAQGAGHPQTLDPGEPS